MRRPAGFWTAGIVLAGLLALGGSARFAASSFSVSPLTAEHTLAPGSFVTDRLSVVNNAQDEVSFSIRAQDFNTDSEGVDSWQTLGSHSRSLGDWISFTPSFLTLPPGGQGFIEYEIRVPDPEEMDSTAPGPEGSYWAAILVQAERAREPLAAPESQRASRLGLTVSFVYAIKIYLNIAGTERPSLQAVDLQAGEEPGSIVATFTNTGNVVLRPRVWMEIRDVNGEVVATLKSLTWSLQPGTRRADFPTPPEHLARYLLGHHYGFSLRDLRDSLPDGQYHLAVIADHGGPRLLGLTAPLTLSAPAEP